MTTSASKTLTSIPVPGLLADGRGSASDRDPATSHEHAPIEDRPVRDPSDVERDEPVTAYARHLWHELDRVAHYLETQIARGGSNGPLVTQPTPLLSTEEQWAEWREVYASVLSALAGPAGDEGYGAQEAQLVYQHGRAAQT